MTTHENGTPATPDWQLPRRQLEDGCSSCGASAVLCGCNRSLDSRDCCGWCSHGPAVLGWDGDQA